MFRYLAIPVILFVLLLLLMQYCETSGKSKREALRNKKIITYIDNYKQLVIEEMLRSGVPASIKLAQGLLESSQGQSELAEKANNHFGIKCGKGWEGMRYSVLSDEWDEKKHRMIPRLGCFRVYNNVTDCYRGHSDLLKNGSRYKELFELPLTDYKSWAYGLQKAGYATDPKYAEKLIKLIEKFGLYKYDRAFPFIPY